MQTAGGQSLALATGVALVADPEVASEFGKNPTLREQGSEAPPKQRKKKAVFTQEIELRNQLSNKPPLQRSRKSRSMTCDASWKLNDDVPTSRTNWQGCIAAGEMLRLMSCIPQKSRDLER